MRTLDQVKLSTPCKLEKVIETVMKRAEGSNIKRTNQQYHTLLILTNGDVDDIQETINSTVKASI